LNTEQIDLIPGGGIGVPIVLTYTVTIYYVFRGKVMLTEESY
jgi:cytochrome bd-type quinol oxidase subunit 2